MPRTSLRNASLVPGYLLAASLCASTAFGQAAPTGNPPPPPAAPPSASPAPSTPPPPAAFPSGPSDTGPSDTAAPPPPPGAPPPPPSAPPSGELGEPGYPPPPPPPRYGRFGGPPEPPIEPGSWDPWAHPIPGRFTHEGFFLRLNLGPGFASISRPDYKWTGLGLGLGLSVGGSLMENLALHADFHTTLVANPQQRAFGRKSDLDADLVMESMGLGLTYHFMPVNIFVSGSAGIGVLVFEQDADGASKDTSAGLTLSAMLGKEWWVGHDWGIGVAGQIFYLRVKDYVDDKRIDALAFNVLFSATYN